MKAIMSNWQDGAPYRMCSCGANLDAAEPHLRGCIELRPTGALASMTVRGVAAICADCGCAFGDDERRHYVRLNGSREKDYICTDCVARGEYRDVFTSSTMREELQRLNLPYGVLEAEGLLTDQFWGDGMFDDLNLDAAGLALVAIINAKGILPFSAQWDALMQSPLHDWLQSKSSGVALAIVEPPNFEMVAGEFYGVYDEHDRERAWRRGSERRMTDAECHRVIGLMDDGAFMAERNAKRRLALAGRTTAVELEQSFRLSYPDIRDYLYFECGAEWVRACRIAFWGIARSNHWRSTHLHRTGNHFAADRERWWI